MIVCKNIVNVNGPSFSQPKKLGTTSVNGSNNPYILSPFDSLGTGNSRTDSFMLLLSLFYR